MLSDILDSKYGLALRLVFAQSITVLFFIFSVISLSFYYGSFLRPELFVMLIYYWAVFRPTLITPVFVFILGLLIDIFSGFPLGLSAFGLVLLQWLVQRQRLFLMGQSFLGLWIGFAVVVSGFVFYKWSVLSLLNFSLLPADIPVLSALVSILVFPIFALILLGVHKILPISE